METRHELADEQLQAHDWVYLDVLCSLVGSFFEYFGDNANIIKMLGDEEHHYWEETQHEVNGATHVREEISPAEWLSRVFNCLRINPE